MKLGSRKIGLLAAGAVLATSIVVAQPAYAADATIHVAPNGSGDTCSVSEPCTIEAAQEFVRDFQTAPDGDITVELADGTYRVDEPLEFRAEDGGREGSTVRWVAADGAEPIISGAQPVTGWTVHDAAKNIYVADTPVGTDSRQLYVNGISTQKATFAVAANSSIAITAAGITLTDAALGFLNSLPDQDRMEFESKGDFTNRFTPITSITGNQVTLAQPAWANNTWGWDTVQYSLLAPSHYYFNNSLAFIDEAGEWYISPDDGKLYYKPATGVNPNDLDIELPTIELLASIGGTLDAPVENLEFSGITFTGTSWLGPSSDEGYATQQNGSYIRGAYSYRPADAFTSCRRGCEMFERTRTEWYQQPAAVQVTAADSVSFEGNTFRNLGSAALGIGNDTNAAFSGVGLGASNIDVVGNIFNEVSGQGIFVGGNRPDAHHPSDPRMTNQDITISDNTVNRVAVDFKDNSGILSTYVTRAHIVNNEVSNVSYDAIDTGYGWGANDAGGSGEYTNRGYYNWNTRYTTDTTLKDNLVAANVVHHAKSKFSDGGSIYNLSATPGSFIERNYVYNVSGVGLYADEGTRYATYRQNVMQNTSPYYFNNSNGDTNTSDNTISGNWFNSGGTSIPNQAANRITVTGNISVSGTAWPAGALEVICEAGVATEYRTHFNANLFTENAACGGRGGPVESPYLTSGVSAASSFFAQDGGSFGIRAAGADVWGGGTQTDDDFGAIYEADEITANSSIIARVDSLNDTNGSAKSGVMIRNDIAQPDTSPGYAIVAVTRSNGVVFQWDANGDGRVETSATGAADLFRPVWVKLVRNVNEYSGFFSYDGVNWTQVGTDVTVPGATALQDGGIFSSSHNVSQSAINVFSEVSIQDEVPVFAVNAATAPTPANGSNGWYKTQPVTVTLTTKNGTAESVEYNLNNAGWQPYTAPVSLTADGTYEVKYRATPFGGDPTMEKAVAVKIDTTVPTATGTVTTNPGNELERTFTIVASDATSGVGSVQYSTNGGATWSTYTNPVSLSTGAQTISARSTDTAGNVSVVSTVEVPQVASCVGTTKNDQFAASPLNKCRWTVLNEDTSLYRIQGGNLEIDTTTGDINNTSTSPIPNLILQGQPSGDWVAETKVDASAFDRQYHAGGIMLYTDDANYIKLYVEQQSATARQVEFRNELNNAIGTPSPNITGIGTVTWLRMAKVGTTYTAYWSADGETWTQVVNAGTPVVFTNANVASAKVGLFAVGTSSQGTVSKTAKFEYFTFGGEEPADETAPTVSASVAGRTVTITAEDADSGVDSIEYQLPGDAGWTEYSAPFAVPGTGLVTVSYRATDVAGNVSDTATVDVPATEPGDIEVDRVAGATRYEGAVNISQAAYPDTAPVVYVTSGENYPDALSAGPAAAHEGGPLLLVQSNSLPAVVAAEIARLDPAKIVVVGGTLSVTEGVFNDLDALTDEIVRVSGVNRYEASRNVADYAFGDADVPLVYIATGEKFPDALAAGGAAGSLDAPVVLVNGSASDLDAETTALLDDLGTTETRVLGGEASVSAGVFADLDAATEATRLGGANRYEAARAINADAFEEAERAFIATGLNFPDALAGSAWAAAAGSPLFVVPGTCVTSGVLADLDALGVTHVTLLGGETSLSPEVFSLTSCG